jgi:hypothetical protein
VWKEIKLSEAPAAGGVSVDEKAEKKKVSKDHQDQLPISIKSFGAGTNGAVWVVDGNGAVWHGADLEKPAGAAAAKPAAEVFAKTWTALPMNSLKMNAISVGGMKGTSVWATAMPKTDSQKKVGEIHIRTEVSDSQTHRGVQAIEGKEWTADGLIGKLSSVHVGRSGAVWGINSVGKVLYREGITSQEEGKAGMAWIAMDNAAFEAFKADPEHAPVPIIMTVISTVSQADDLE